VWETEEGSGGRHGEDGGTTNTRWSSGSDLRTGAVSREVFILAHSRQEGTAPVANQGAARADTTNDRWVPHSCCFSKLNKPNISFPPKKNR
jgi:hypothetical protein